MRVFVCASPGYEIGVVASFLGRAFLKHGAALEVATRHGVVVEAAAVAGVRVVSRRSPRWRNGRMALDAALGAWAGAAVVFWDLASVEEAAAIGMLADLGKLRGVYGPGGGALDLDDARGMAERVADASLRRGWAVTFGGGVGAGGR